MDGTEATLDMAFIPAGDLIEMYATRHPKKCALYDLETDSALTWEDIREWSCRIANRLEDFGIRHGDRVALVADECVEKLLIWLGVWRLGAVVCLFDVGMKAETLAEMLGAAAPRLLLWNDGATEVPSLNMPALPRKRFACWPAGEFLGTLDEVATVRQPRREVAATDVAAIFCTSGTTAKPKAVVCDHLSYWLWGLSSLDIIGLTSEDRTLEYRSFAWSSSHCYSFMPWLQRGHTLYVARRFSYSRFFGWIRQHGITFSVTVPAVINMLVSRPTGVTAADVPTLRHVICSSAPLSEAQWRRFETIHGIKLLQICGASEGGPICGNRFYRRKIGTIGLPAKYQQFAIVDRDGNPCPLGSEGEVTIGGPQLCLGIIQVDGSFEPTAGTRFRTGDLAVMDEEGFVRITGRTKDLIIRGGVNIAPLEIDSLLHQHPHVCEAAAVGVPDAIYGEEVIAFAVVKPGTGGSTRELLEYCSAALGDRAPKHIFLIDEIPKTERGKVNRAALYEHWKHKHAVEMLRSQPSASSPIELLK
jgi:acyl-coenzyme A synthetase/AMP-(fatty) acid ligase